MPKKEKPRVAAVIDIGSNELKLKIAQAGKGGMQYLETLRYPLFLGRDTFQTGKMSFDKADKACEVIKNFLTVAASYAVKDIRTVATTAVREAANSDYILDQIKIKTGLDVHVIDDHDEKMYTYKMLSHFMDRDLQSSAVMVYIGAGSIGVSVLANGKIPYAQTIMVGSLRIGELFGGLEERTSEFYRLVEEYLATFTESLAADLGTDIRHFVVSGQDIGMIAELCGVTMDSLLNDIPKDDFLALYEDIKLKTADKTAIDYGIDDDKAELLLPAACIYQNLLRFTRAENITASRILPCDAILYEMLYPAVFIDINKRFGKNTLLSARGLAKRYMASEPHYTLVNGLALNIFNKMKKIHGLASREKLLLQTAAILHDIGKYVNVRRHYQHSYELVNGADIVGLNHLETEIVALICLYHARITPTEGKPPTATRYAALSADNRVLVSKLTAILRVADALDRSHSQKCSPKSVSVKVTDDALVITVVTDQNIALEQWAFGEKSRFFEEVFGIKAELHIKRPIG